MADEESPQVAQDGERGLNDEANDGSDEEASTEEETPTVFELLKLKGSEPDDKEVAAIIDRMFEKTVAKHDVSKLYNVAFLMDTSALHRIDADKIYRSLSDLESEKPLLLILSSSGGDIAAAYLIGKLCREKSGDKFAIAVPRRAKSAATLICCGADEIHMGSLSELGPIDPQFDQIPALALKYSIEHLAELSKRYPAASDMFANYLSQSLNIEELGYYERVAESATQYAERLLKSRNVNATKDRIVKVARRLVYQYKDHGFVIDSSESAEIFGDEVIKLETPEYELANDLFIDFSFILRLVSNLFGRQIYVVGTPGNGCKVFSTS